MIVLLYNLALLAALIVGSPWWLWRLATTQKYREGLKQRLGRVPEHLRATSKQRPVIWLHAVSVGEVLAVSRLVKELDQELPKYTVMVSTTTRTGQALARERFGAERVFYCPLDLPWAVRAYLDALRPRLLILAETEFWPNLLSGCFRRRVPVAVVNARVSDRSWPRYRSLRPLWQPILTRLTTVLAQSEVDAERLRAIGCAGNRVAVGGNLKFDVRVAEQAPAARALRPLVQTMRLVVAGSTLEGEEAALLEAWPQLLAVDPNLLLVIAPRHPERFGRVADLIRTSGFGGTRRSAWGPEPAPPAAGTIVLLDSIGELASVYSLAAVAFVGGSLVAAGGHNPLEPAQFGVPIVMGPHYENFRAITDDLRAHQAVGILDEAGFAAGLIDLLLHPGLASAMGERARSVFEQQSGATQRCVEAIVALLRDAELAAGTDGSPAPAELPL